MLGDLLGGGGGGAGVLTTVVKTVTPDGQLRDAATVDRNLNQVKGRADLTAHSAIPCASVAIEIRQTKRRIVYRAVVATGPGAETTTRTFRTKVAAEEWEREQLEAIRRASASGAGDACRTPRAPA